MSGKCLYLDEYCRFWQVDGGPDGGECTVKDKKGCPIEAMAAKAKKPGRIRMALAAENARLKRDYALFEEMSPPDMPREEFVRWCYQAWANRDEEIDKLTEPNQEAGKCC
jgi:hypothetical protein